MKITEELWNQKAREFCNFKTDAWGIDHTDYDRTELYYKGILRSITGKEIFTSYPNFQGIRGDIVKGEDFLQGINYSLKVNTFFTRQEFMTTYDLTPGFSCVVPIFNGTEKLIEYVVEGKQLESMEGFSIDDLALSTSVIVSNRDSNAPVLYSRATGYDTRPVFMFGNDLAMILRHVPVGFIPSLIFFTSESSSTVCKIYNDFQEYIKLELQREVKKGSYKINIGNSSGFGPGIDFTAVEVDVDNTIDPDKQYNTDLPKEEIDKFIKSKEGGLSIFYGKPGCGKSSYIKYLAQTHTNRIFNILSQDLLLSGLSGFRKHLLTKDQGGGTCIYIIEDCEKLLISRDKSFGDTSVISELLNLSDGIFGDYLKVKFILTFNANIPDLDTALLRKGRLKVKYEFKPLSGERLETLAKELGINLTEEEKKSGLSLADLYNHESRVDFSVQEKRKLGF